MLGKQAKFGIFRFEASCSDFRKCGTRCVKNGMLIKNAQPFYLPSLFETLPGDFSVPFLETSAKTGMNVDLCFEAAARELLKMELVTNGGAVTRGNPYQQQQDKFNIGLYVSEKEQRPGCCG